MRNCRRITAGIGLLLLSSCQPNPPKQATIQSSPQAFAEPIVPPKSQTLPTIKIPGMISTSENKTPLMPVAASTRDPFAATTIPTNLKATIQPAAKSTALTSSNPNQPVAIPPQPTIAYRPLSPQPTPLSAQPATLPIVPIAPPNPNFVPSAPTVSQTNLADAIALTGVIQTGSRLSAIVQDTDGSSRYVQVGESLANGQITVKKINLNSAGNPSIVLVQNGVEFTKLVGQTAS